MYCYVTLEMAIWISNQIVRVYLILYSLKYKLCGHTKDAKKKCIHFLRNEKAILKL